jgi:hypothetical protein
MSYTLKVMFFNKVINDRHKYQVLSIKTKELILSEEFELKNEDAAG